jgi:hypothetical protein
LLGPTSAVIEEQLRQLKQRKIAVDEEVKKLKADLKVANEPKKVFDVNVRRDGLVETLLKILILIAGLYGGLQPIVIVGRFILRSTNRIVKGKSNTSDGPTTESELS